MIKHHIVATATLVLSFAIAACAGDADPVTPTSVRDSSGVEIVESHEPLWSAGRGWTVSERPVASVGSEDASEEYSLYRVMAALRLPNGNIVIANSGTHQLKFYDSSGAFIRSVGREGEGPGEFRRMMYAWPVGDSIFVADYGLSRVSVFSAEGEFGRTVTLDKPPESFGVTASGGFSDGSILGFEFVFDRTAPPDGLHRSDMRFLYRRYSREGDVMDSLGVFLQSESIRESTTITNPTTGETGRGMMSSSAPFGLSGTTTARGDFLYHGTGGSYEIQQFTREGALARLIRRPIPNPAVTESDKDLFREDWLEDAGDWQRSRVLDLKFPDTKPAYGRFRVYALGNLWVEDYSIGRKHKTGVWTVFDPEGRMLGTVQVDRGLAVTAIGDDYVMGVWRSEFDVEQVRVYRLTKGDVGRD